MLETVALCFYVLRVDMKLRLTDDVNVFVPEIGWSMTHCIRLLTWESSTTMNRIIPTLHVNICLDEVPAAPGGRDGITLIPSFHRFR